MTHVLLVNSVALNGGDAAIGEALRKHVEQVFGADVSITVADPGWRAAERLHGDARRRFVAPAADAVLRYPKIKYLGRLVRDLNLWRWRTAAGGQTWLLRAIEQRKLAQYTDADAVISCGGTYLMERYGIWPKTFELDLAQAAGRPTLLYAQSIGPLTRADSRRAVKRVSERAQRLYLRDEASAGVLRAAGIHAGEVVADGVFTFADAGDRLRQPAGPLRRVAISVRTWPFSDAQAAFEAAIGRLATHLVRTHGADVTFISTCQGVPEYWTDDAEAAQRIATTLDADIRARVFVDRLHRSRQALQDVMRTYDLAIATRMHLGIIALCAGTPVLPIAYEPKTHALAARLGLDAYVVDFDAADDIPQTLDRLWATQDQWRDRLADGVEHQRVLADRMVDGIALLLSERAPGSRTR